MRETNTTDPDNFPPNPSPSAEPEDSALNAAETEAVLARAGELIRAKARKLARRSGFRRHDAEDVEQELTLRLLARLPSFDPEAGSLDGYVAMILDQGACSLARDRHAQRRDPAREVPLVEEAAAPDDSSRIDLDADLDAFLGGLDEGDRLLALALLSGNSQAAAGRLLGLGRRALGHAVSRIRRRAAELGLRDYLPENRSTGGPTG